MTVGWGRLGMLECIVVPVHGIWICGLAVYSGTWDLPVLGDALFPRLCSWLRGLVGQMVAEDWAVVFSRRSYVS